MGVSGLTGVRVAFLQTDQQLELIVLADLIFFDGQDSRNCGILASGMGGSGERESKSEETMHRQGLKILHKSVFFVETLFAQRFQRK